MSQTTVLVTGGAGFTGCVLTPRLLERGYDVRVLDCLWWGDEPLADFRDRIDLIEGDVRDMPTSVLDGVDAVVHLAALSNDPTAENDPAANWQIGAVATEELGRACLERGIRRFIFTSSASLYDGLPEGMHDETAAVEPVGEYATAKRYAEERLIEAGREGLEPVILRNGTLYGWSPRMRFDLVVNTFLRDALIHGRLQLHGGGWMSRPLLDVRDAAGAIIAALEAPSDAVASQIFNVLHSNHQIRELAMDVAGSLRMLGREVELVEVPAPVMNRTYALSNVKLAERAGFMAGHSVLDGISHMLDKLPLDDPRQFEEPRYVNLSWLKQLESSADAPGQPAE
jgi:nucleoside-diphosphate-sugar epimerase